MSINDSIQKTLIGHALEQALDLEGWTLEEFSFPDDKKVVGAVALTGSATKDGEAAQLHSAWVDGDADAETIRVTLIDSTGDLIEVERQIVIACVGHVIGGKPRTLPDWATKENADKIRGTCDRAGATNGDVSHSRVLHGIGEPPLGMS